VGVGGFSFYISMITAFGGAIAILETHWACYRQATSPLRVSQLFRDYFGTIRILIFDFEPSPLS
jgi:hypothetical protein